ncbi:hypothetical protein [Sulfurimicrobium lacus]|uniref:hypothetical protein n=1 Tax=Sulfurimicrobium lacus TaxID=2715678 RepID=UPI001563E709|nr:hypothetical protein [Sulfurimicrobium lacus]
MLTLICIKVATAKHEGIKIRLVRITEKAKAADLLWGRLDFMRCAYTLRHGVFLIYFYFFALFRGLPEANFCNARIKRFSPVAHLVSHWRCTLCMGGQAG